MTFSARSSSARAPVPSTFTLAPKILILSVSIARIASLEVRFRKGGGSGDALTGIGNENFSVL